APVGRDPLGPKPRELPSLANLSVHLAGDQGLAARWSIGPAPGSATGRLTVIGPRGKAVLLMPADGDWLVEIAGDQLASESYSPQQEAEDVFRRLSQATTSAASYNEGAWLSACR